MKPDDAIGWSFDGPLVASSEVRCNQCEVFSPLAAWTEGSVYCEDCGDHAAMCCPECGACEDHVWSDRQPMAVRDSTDNRPAAG